MRNVIIVGSTLVIILAVMVMSFNTVETTSDVTVIKMLPADWNPYQRLYDELLSPTVRINTKDGIGSGVIIHHKDTKNTEKSIYILTANHVVGNQSVVTVTLYSQNIITSLSASVVITDTNKDLALLRITNPPQSPFVKGGNRVIYSANLAPRDYNYYLFTPIYAVGCSLGLDPRPSSGIISAIHLSGLCVSAVEVSSPILPGNSGGPVYDAKTHEIIGIAIWVKTYYGQLITTMAGIVPIQTIYEFLDEFYHKDTENTKSSLCPLCLCGEYCQSVVVASGSARKWWPTLSEPVQLTDITHMKGGE